MAASSGTEAPSGLPQLATAVAAVVGVVGSLAVTGVLAEAQRNHGIALLVSFSCVLAGAVLWLIAGLLPSKRKTIDAPRRHQRLRRLVRWGRNLAPGFRVLALRQTRAARRLRATSPARAEKTARRRRSRLGSPGGSQAFLPIGPRHLLFAPETTEPQP